MSKKIWAAAIACVAVISGCGGQSLKSIMAGGSQPTATGDMTPQQRSIARFKALQLLGETCNTCDVTGGGAGNESACGDAKFGLVAQDGVIGQEDSGRLNFSAAFDDDKFHINGPVDEVQCIEIFPGENGDTYGTVKFTGPVQVEKGLDGAYRFIVTVTDFGEPNKDDHLVIEIYDENGGLIYSYECDTDDGNIQLHPTRAAQI